MRKLLALLIITTIFLSCRKRTQEFDYSPLFLNKQLVYTVSLGDTVTYENDGTLTFNKTIILNGNEHSIQTYDVKYISTNHSSSTSSYLYYILPIPYVMYFTQGGFY